MTASKYERSLGFARCENDDSRTRDLNTARKTAGPSAHPKSNKNSLSFLAVCSGVFNTYLVGSFRRTRQLKLRQAGTSSADKEVRLFTRDGTRAFEFAYRSYFEFVRNICLRMLRDPVEAEDAAQDVFVCVLCKLDTFRGEAAFSSWLYRLTTNSVLMRFRRNRCAYVPLEEPTEDDNDSSTEIGAPDLNLSGLLDRIDLQSAIDVLPNGYKTAFLLHDVEGYEHREIAEMRGNSIGNSKSQLHKARLKLRKLLGGIPARFQQQRAIPSSREAKCRPGRPQVCVTHRAVPREQSHRTLVRSVISN